MNKIIFFTAIAATVLVGCSEEDPIPSPGETGKEVGFRTVTDKGTRAAVTDDRNMLSFTVTGWWDQDGSNSYGDLSKGSYLFNAKDITRGEGGTWDYTPKRYWPTTGTVDFFAYSPASSINLNKGLNGLKAATPAIKYTVPMVAENNAQEDFLVATLLDSIKGTVTLNFQHALSRVKFEAKKKVKDVEYVIDSIALVNLSSTAELDLTAVNVTTSVIPKSGGFKYDPASPLVLWAGHTTDTTYAVDFSNSPVSVMYDDYTSVIGATNGLMVMPQATELGQIYVKTEIGDNKTNSNTAVTLADVATPKEGFEKCFYIKVSYKAFQGTGSDIFYYAGNATSSKHMYIPVKDSKDNNKGLTFEIGRQYVFRLTFGDKDNGSGELGDAIKFDVDVQAWDDVEVNL